MNSRWMILHRRGQLSCRQVGKLMQRYLDGEVDDVDAAKVHAHLDDCRRCGLEAGIYERVKMSLASHGRCGPADIDALASLREFGDRLAMGEGTPPGH